MGISSITTGLAWANSETHAELLHKLEDVNASMTAAGIPPFERAKRLNANRYELIDSLFLDFWHAMADVVSSCETTPLEALLKESTGDDLTWILAEIGERNGVEGFTWDIYDWEDPVHADISSEYEDALIVAVWDLIYLPAAHEAIRDFIDALQVEAAPGLAA